MKKCLTRSANGAIGIWCVKDLETGQKLGGSYLLPMPVDEDYSKHVMGQMSDVDIEIGYFLKPSAWGQGYATEVCKHLLKFAFENLAVDKIVASVDDDNTASKKVLKKVRISRSRPHEMLRRKQPYLQDLAR